ncbi:MAG: sodium:calcium antiporter [Calditrichaeota bacterium]|nr:MAG: sodium:calcium antiporter [Calditrichota bacterium]
MLIELIRFLVGITGLWVGAELLVRYSSRLARSFGVSPVIIGLTVVSMGTSAPELVVSLVAAFHHNTDIALGNIIGSNIANIGLILGVGALICPIDVQKNWVHREVPFMIFVTLVFMGLGLWGHSLGPPDGAVLLLLMIAFLLYLGKNSLKEMSTFREAQDALGNPDRVSLKQRLVYFALAMAGLAILLGGSELTVGAGQTIARRLGVSDVVIGLTMIAVGTSLPELATTVVGAYRREMDLVVGNVIGSNVFNLLLIGGVVSLVEPMHLTRAMFTREMPFLLGLSVIVWPTMRYRWNLQRYEGLLFLLIYAWFVYRIV